MKRGFRAWVVFVAAAALCALPGTAIAGGSNEAAGKYNCVETEKKLSVSADGTYRYAGDSGKYDYRAAKQKVTFTSGPLSAYWGNRVFGDFGGIDLYKKRGDKFKAACIDSDQPSS